MRKNRKRMTRLLSWLLALVMVVGLMPASALAVGGETGTSSSPQRVVGSGSENATVTVTYGDLDRSTATVTYHKEGIDPTAYNLIFLVDLTDDNAHDAFERMMRNGGLDYIFDYGAKSTVQLITYSGSATNSGVLDTKVKVSSALGQHGGTVGSGVANAAAALDAAIAAVKTAEGTNNYQTVVFWVLGDRLGNNADQVPTKLEALNEALAYKKSGWGEGEVSNALITWQLGTQGINQFLADAATAYTPAHKTEETTAAYYASTVTAFEQGLAESLEQVVHDHYHDIQFDLSLKNGQTLVNQIKSAKVVSASSAIDVTATLKDSDKTVSVEVDWLCRQADVDFVLELELNTGNDYYKKETVIESYTITDSHTGGTTRVVTGTGGGLHTGLFDEEIQSNLALTLPAVDIDRAKRTVTFEGVTGVSDIQALPGTLIRLPDNPTLSGAADGAIFSGWQATIDNVTLAYDPGEIVAVPEQDSTTFTALTGGVEVELSVGTATAPGDPGNQMIEGDYDSDQSPLYFNVSTGSTTISNKDITEIKVVDETLSYLPVNDGSDPNRVTVRDGTTNEVAYARHIGATDNDKVVAYLSPNNGGSGTTYTLYLAGPGGVTAPTDATGLFMGGEAEKGKTMADWTNNSESSFVSNVESEDTVLEVWRVPNQNVTSIDVSLLDTSGSTTLNYLFAGLTKLDTLTGEEKLNTGSAQVMTGVFRNCADLEELSVSSWNVTKMYAANYMFYGCTELTTLDLSGWTTSSMTNTDLMFRSCCNMTTLTLGDGWTTSKVTSMSSMFRDCADLTTVDVKDWDVSKVTNMEYMFSQCSALTTLDVSGWTTSKLENMRYLFNGCTKLETLNMSNWNTSNVTNMAGVFNQCKALTTLDLDTWNVSNVTNFSYLFQGCSELTELKVSNWQILTDTSKRVLMTHMFIDCTHLKTLDLTNWDTSNVSHMTGMFQNFATGVTNEYTLSVTYFDNLNPTTGVTTELVTASSFKMINAGTYVFTAKKSGQIGSEVTGTITIYITPRDLNSEGITATYGTEEYDGSTHQNHTTAVEDNGLKTEDGSTSTDKYTLNPQTAETTTEYADATSRPDYKVIDGHDHSSHKDVGTYTSTIQGVGNYSGTREVTFTITPKKITIPADFQYTLSYGYSSNDAENALTTVKANINSKEQTAQEYAKSQLAKVWTDGMTATESYEDLGINLYIDVGLSVGANQAHVHGTLSDGTGNNAGKASNYVLDIKATVTVTGTDITQGGGSSGSGFRVEVSPTEGYFTGSAQQFGVYVIHGSTLLTENEDYQLKYYKGTETTGDSIAKDVIIDPGTYTIVVDADFNKDTAGADDKYTGKFTATYTVKPANPSGGDPEKPGDTTTGLHIGAINSQTYTGSEIKPDLTVTFNGTRLREKTQDTSGYTVTWKNNTNVGWATVTVNYNGLTATQFFQITPKSIGDSSIAVSGINEEGYPYTGAPVTITELTVTDSNRTDTDQPLKEGVDYYLTYQNNTDPSEYAQVTVHGMGNYSGTKVVNFTINKASIGGDGSNPGETAQGFSVAVYPPTNVYTGEPHHPAVVVTYNGMKLTETEDYTLTYRKGNENVGANGMIEPGTYTITVQGVNKYSGSVEKPYAITGVGQSGALKVEITGSKSFQYDGDEQTVALKVTYNNTELNASNDYTVEYSANVNVGTATVFVTGKGGTYDGMTGSATFQITPRPINASEISVENVAQKYAFTGSAIQIRPLLTDSVLPNGPSGQTLDEGVDYTVTFDGNTTVGQHTITITGRGNYGGQRTVEFEIEQATMTNNGAFTVNLYPDTAVYTGSAQEPEVVVHYNNLLLTENDYTVSYAVKNDEQGELDTTYQLPKGIGTYTVTIQGKGNYQGSLSAEFTITQAQDGDLRVEVTDDSLVYTGSEITPTLKVQSYSNSSGGWTNLTQGSSSNENYTITYTPVDRTNAGLVLVTVTGASGTAYDGKTATAAFRINPDTIEDSWVSGVDGSYPYTGSPITPEVTVQHDSTTLVLNQDYTVEYANNLDVATGDKTATVTIRGIGNYTGSVTKTFKITQTSIGGDGSDGDNGIVVNVYPESGVHTGEAHTPTILVEHNGMRLNQGTDYQVQIQNSAGTDVTSGGMVEVGTYTITVTGQNNYSGMVTKTYTILSPGDHELKVAFVSGADSNLVYNGQEHKPEVTVTYNDKTLAQGNDYTVTYSDNTNAGTGKVVVKGAVGTSYEGLETTLTFEIAKRNISEANVGEIDDVEFDGQAKTPALTITDNLEVNRSTASLASGTDYYAIYTSNVNAGIAQVAIYGIGNYQGSTNTTFTIKPASSGSLSIANIPGQLYSGAAIKPTLQVTYTSNTGVKITLGPDDYEAEFNNNIAVGMARVTVTGVGNYEGLTANTTFQITANVHALTVKVDPAQIEGTTDSPTVTVTLLNGTNELELNTAYELVYQKLDEDGKLVTVENLTDTGVYTITAKGKQRTDYEGATGSATFVRLPNTQSGENIEFDGNGLKIEGNLLTLTYDGTNQYDELAKVTVSNKNGSGNLAYNYTVTHVGSNTTVNDVINAGLYQMNITITGSGQTGKATLVVLVQQAELTVSGTANVPLGTDVDEFDWSELTVVGLVPADVNASSRLKLEYVVDTSVEGSKPVTVTLSGSMAGNYILTNTATANVTDIGSRTFTASLSATSGYADNGQPHTPKVTVTDSADQNRSMVEGTDYRVEYVNSAGQVVGQMADVGVYTVRVIGLGSYEGCTVELKYQIKGVPSGGITPGGDEDEDTTPGIADPDDTGVSGWLETEAHNAYLKGYGDGIFKPLANMTRAEVAQMFYNLLLDKDVAITVTFTDVPRGQWYYTAVNTMASLGILKGDGDGTFRPNDPITRAEFTAIAMRFTNGQAEITGSFTDVSPTEWYYREVMGAVSYGWIKGDGDGTFRPKDPITRAEVTAITNRMLGRVADKDYIDANRYSLPVSFIDNLRAYWAYYDIVEATNGHRYTHEDGEESWEGVRW